MKRIPFSPLLILLLTLLLLLSGCVEGPAAGQSSPPPEESASPQVSQPPEESEDPDPLASYRAEREAREALRAERTALCDENGDGAVDAGEFPRPTGDLFGLSGTEAQLYDAAAGHILDRFLENMGAGGGDLPDDLMLPALILYGEYPGEEGETHYLCSVNVYFYYGLDLATLTYSDIGGGGVLTRVTLSAEGELTDYQETYDGDSDPDARIRELCGPLTDLAAALCGETEAGAEGRALTPWDHDELLGVYTAHVFP